MIRAQETARLWQARTSLQNGNTRTLLHENGERSDATPKNEKSAWSAMERDVDAETPETS
jgi:hypothetical protein